MPGITAAWSFDFAIESAVRTATFDVSVASLFPEFGSVMPAGADTVAVFATRPLAAGDAMPLMVKVTRPPETRSAVVSMLPVPEPAPHVAPIDTHVQVGVSSSGGRMSRTNAPVTNAGPLFSTVTV